MQLVIVESPAKARTINKYLGSDYKVIASFGHVRDLSPKDGSVLPDQDFAMVWQTSPEATRHLKEIASEAKKADHIILATDPDREGEAIAWHVVEALAGKRLLTDKSIERVAFNAITKTAVLEAIRHPRQIDQQLVDAYLARRALDYLVGFSLSPVLWRKLPGARSAGRVQSVALRIIVDREIEIEKFISREYWLVSARLWTGKGEEFLARLYAMDGKKLDKFAFANNQEVEAALELIRSGEFVIDNIESKELRRNPAPPFTTSTLQQEAARKLGIDAKSTMQTAQKLYEAGHITYMRTDGVQMAEEAYIGARDAINKRFGPDYLPPSPRRYSSKARNAQEAHEAVRPTNFALGPGQAGENDLQLKLYELIWKRAVTSQMEAARLQQVRIDILGKDGRVHLRASGQTVLFDGFFALYREGRDDTEDKESEDKEKETILPSMAVGESTRLLKADSKQSATVPPPRYSESSLVKRMEELGIGRPSTYATVLSTLRDRGYVRMERKRFVPEGTGRLTTVFLAQFFERYVAYDFTADLEEKLDLISGGKLAWKSLLAEFWRDFHDQIEKTTILGTSDIITDLDKDMETYMFPPGEDKKDPRICPDCQDGRLGLKLGRHGPFIGCSAYPECRYIRQFPTSENKSDAIDVANKILGPDPKTGENILLKSGRFGPYVEIAGGEKSVRSSIPKDWDANIIDLDKALQLLSLPRQIGLHPEDQQPVQAGIGRYGPYVRHNNIYVNLPSSDEVFAIGLNRAVAIIADRKANPAGRRGTAEVLRELGTHPQDGAPINLLKGRYGPYVKYDSINATVPKGMSPEELTLEQALELIAARQQKGSSAGKKGKPGKKRVRKADPAL